MKLKLQDKSHDYFPNSLSNLSSEIKAFDQLLTSPDQEFEKAKKNYDKNFPSRPVRRPQNPLMQNRKNVVYSRLGTFQRDLNISDSHIQEELQKVVTSQIYSDRNHYRDKITIPNAGTEYNTRIKLHSPDDFESYNKAQKQVDKVIKTTLNFLKTDLDREVKDLEFDDIISRLCPYKINSGSPRKIEVSPLKSPRIDAAKPRSSRYRENVQTPRRSILPSPPKEVVRDSVLTGFERKEKKEKKESLKASKERQEYNRQESLEVYFKVKEKTQLHTERYLSKLSQESRRVSTLMKSRDESSSSMSPLALSRRETEDATEKSQERKSPRPLVYSPLRVLNMTNRCTSPTSPTEFEKNSPRGTRKIKIKVFNPLKRKDVLKQTLNQSGINEMEMSSIVKTDVSTENDYNIFFGNPDKEQTHYKKLMKNIGLGLLPLYDKEKTLHKGVKAFKRESVGVPVAKLTAKDFAKAKEKMDVDLKNSAFKNIIRPQDVIKFDTEDVLL